MVFDPRSDDDHSPVWINGESWAGNNIQVFDFQLHWAHQVEYVCSQMSQRLYFLWRLRVHGVDKSIMLLFYRAAIDLLFVTTSQHGLVTCPLNSNNNSKTWSKGLEKYVACCPHLLSRRYLRRQCGGRALKSPVTQTTSFTESTSWCLLAEATGYQTVSLTGINSL